MHLTFVQPWYCCGLPKLCFLVSTESISHKIHVWYIYIYILYFWSIFMVNVGKHIPYMVCMDIFICVKETPNSNLPSPTGFSSVVAAPDWYGFPVFFQVECESRCLILLIDKIRLTTKDDDYPIIYRFLTIPGGAGFRPSTVCWVEEIFGRDEMTMNKNYAAWPRL